MRVTRAEVIKTASDMADRNGLHNVSLKAIAENLGIRTPSLYNHIGSSFYNFGFCNSHIHFPLSTHHLLHFK